MPQLATLNMVGNQLGGSLPASWGVNGSFQRLINLRVSRSTCHWAAADTLPSLGNL